MSLYEIGRNRFMYLFLKPLDGVKVRKVKAAFSPILFRIRKLLFLNLLSLQHSRVIYLDLKLKDEALLKKFEQS